MDVLSILGQLAETSADPRIRTLVKSLTSTQAGVNLAALTGGGATRVEALEPELATATVQNPHFVLFNLLFPNRHTSWSLIDQQVVQDGIGGYPGSAVSNETGSNLNQRNGAYHRVITELKVLAEFGGVTVPTAMQGALQQAAGAADFNSAEQEIFSALSRVLQTAEWELIFGDPTMSPLEFQGIIPGLLANAPQNVLNLGGIALNTGSQVAPLAARISGFGSWGSPDALIVSPACKADFDGHLEAGYRVNLDANVPSTTLGAMVKSIKYNGLGIGNGVLDLYPHVFLDENMRQPVENFAATEISGNAPASMTGVASGATGSIPAGTYAYRVEAAGPGFVSSSVLVTGSTVVVAATNQVALTITQSSGAAESYYNVYRSSKNGSTASNMCRFIGRVAKTGATTVFTDTNATIPGTSQAIMLTSAPQYDALRLVQMAPPSKIPLAMTTLQYQFAVMYLACLRLSLPKKHALITNILPSNATWLP